MSQYIAYLLILWPEKQSFNWIVFFKLMIFFVTTYLFSQIHFYETFMADNVFNFLCNNQSIMTLTYLSQYYVILIETNVIYKVNFPY